MIEKNNLDIVKSIYRNFLDGKIDEMLDLFVEDIDWTGFMRWHGGPNPLPYAGKWANREELKKAFQLFRNTVQYERPTADNEYIIKGDRVLVVGRDLRRVVATGEIVESRWSMLWTIENGKVVQANIYEDTVEAMNELEAEDTEFSNS